jgi:hypothetical protein
MQRNNSPGAAAARSGGAQVQAGQSSRRAAKRSVSSWRQWVALCHTNWLLKKRRPVQLVVELLLPVVFMVSFAEPPARQHLVNFMPRVSPAQPVHEVQQYECNACLMSYVVVAALSVPHTPLLFKKQLTNVNSAHTHVLHVCNR